ncbi:MAG: circularly permuted type 2 ATP-grasp protein [Chloroflexi bacterium]|nr:circularly permuted type 2 ATP-grasp protein [Chloroflexota bacterium]
MQLNEAIDVYHSLLDDDLAAEASAELYQRLRPRHLYFGSRPLCTVLRPYFYLADDWNYLKRETEVLLGAFARAHEACLHSADLRQQLALESYEEQLFSLDIGGVIPWTTSRLDSFFLVNQKTLKYVEYNAETPAGMGYEDILAEVFLELEPMKRFQQHYNVQSMPMLGDLLNALLRAYKDWGGHDKPQIAIVDWREVPTLNEHEICRDYFERHGVRTIMVDPRALEFRDGHLWAGRFRVDLIYKRVLISELIFRMGVDNAITRAVKARAVLMTNSFSAKLMAKKASFAFLSDERNAHLFTADQQRVIAAHIPWTRLISQRKTMYQGQEIDLVEYVALHPDNFVLKPNDEYGGKGVIIGWETPPERWHAALAEALNTPYVVQERVSTIVRNFPAWIDGALDISPRFVDANPYVFYGNTVHGCLTRLSSLALLNVTAGGGSVVPTFLISKKE